MAGSLLQRPLTGGLMPNLYANSVPAANASGPFPLPLTSLNRFLLVSISSPAALSSFN